jgi:LysM repeat protein
MTEQERQQTFVEALNQLSQQYGFTLNAVIQAEQLNNNVVQARAIVVVEPVADWKPVSQVPATETTQLMPTTH